MRKVVCIILCMLMLVSVIPITSCAASNPYPYSYQVDAGYGYPARSIVNCTWYAWQQAYERVGVALPGFGNAGNWYDNAVAHGYSVGSAARVNSIAVYTDSGYGHVAYVTAVNGNTMTTVEGGAVRQFKRYQNGRSLCCSRFSI